MAPRRPDRITRSEAHLQDPSEYTGGSATSHHAHNYRSLDGLADTEEQQEWSQDVKISLEVHDKK